MPGKQKKILRKTSNWGNYPQIDTVLHVFKSENNLLEKLNHLNKVIPRGKGRCYGDSSLASNIVSTLLYNGVLSFDDKKGIISCQSGVIIEDLLKVIVPKGWFLPVVPGTKTVTIGGAIASDIHGKNHHNEGCFSSHIIEIELMLENGTIVKCSREKSPEIYWLTCGGMGLTGVILTATFQLKPIGTAYIKCEMVKAKNLIEIMDLFEKSNDWTYTVAWIDCLSKGENMGRSIMIRGDHALKEELPAHKNGNIPLKTKNRRRINIPFYFPSFILNPITVKIFNSIYYSRLTRSPKKSIIDYDSFFFPLDSIRHWNKMYGKKGFTQYQFVLPKNKSFEGLVEVFDKIREKGEGPFLAVLKLFGKQEGILSFPMEGYTLSLDFPIRDGLFEFFDELDSIVLKNGGRIYLAKDVRMSRDMFFKSYPNAVKFVNKIKELNQNLKFSSLQSERLGITDG